MAMKKINSPPLNNNSPTFFFLSEMWRAGRGRGREGGPADEFQLARAPALRYSGGRPGDLCQLARLCPPGAEVRLFHLAGSAPDVYKRQPPNVGPILPFMTASCNSRLYQQPSY